jgi:hypothetical protein
VNVVDPHDLHGGASSDLDLVDQFAPLAEAGEVLGDDRGDAPAAPGAAATGRVRRDQDVGPTTPGLPPAAAPVTSIAAPPSPP